MAVKSLGTLTYTDQGQWIVAAAPHVAMRIKRIFPRVRTASTGEITIRDTPEIARDLEWLLTRWALDIDDKSADRLTARAAQHRETEHAIDHILSGARRDLTLPNSPAREPRDYQIQAADLALTTGRLLLTDEVGLGKSMSGLLLLRDPNALPALVVTLTHLPSQWISELEKTFPTLTGHILRNGDPYDPADRVGRDPDVVVTSYSKLAKWRDVLDGAFKTVIFDEMQELRHADSMKFQAAEQIARHADWKVGLTATPVYNYAGEIHNILSILDPDALGSRDEFLREWSAVIDASNNIHVRRADALGEYLRDQGLMLRRTRTEVGREITEPVLVEQPVPTDHQVLDDAESQVAELARLILDTDSDPSKRWAASGEIDWRMRQATGLAKARYVADFVRLLLESEEKIVLFGWHREVYDIWMYRLASYLPRLYTGSESVNQKTQAVDAFVNGNCRILIVSLRAGAGLDGLQEASKVAVFGELDWSPGIHEQCVGRLWRDGQEGAVIAYYLVSDGGTDPLMTQVLGLKAREQRALSGDQKLLNTETLATSDRVRRLAESVLKTNPPEMAHA